MKTAIYIKDGLFQVVLTGESDLERMALKKITSNKNLETYEGSFYECQGGWSRIGDSTDRSTIFVCREEVKTDD